MKKLGDTHQNLLENAKCNHEHGSQSYSAKGLLSPVLTSRLSYVVGIYLSFNTQQHLQTVYRNLISVDIFQR